MVFLKLQSPVQCPIQIFVLELPLVFLIITNIQYCFLRHRSIGSWVHLKTLNLEPFFYFVLQTYPPIFLHQVFSSSFSLRICTFLVTLHFLTMLSFEESTLICIWVVNAHSKECMVLLIHSSLVEHRIYEEQEEKFLTIFYNVKHTHLPPSLFMLPPSQTVVRSNGLDF